MTRFETVAIGDELLCGKIADTNTAYVADQLYRRGYRLSQVTVIADDIPQITSTLAERARHAEMVICFGGLGPTSDDKTAQAVAQILGVAVVSDEASRVRLEAFCQERGRDMTPQMLKQVLLPQGADPIPNTAGLAVGFSCLIEKCRFFFLPGVPSEMRAMVQLTLLPWLETKRQSNEPSLWTRTWRLIGIPESELQRVMDPVESSLSENAWLGYRTKFPENHLTVYFKAPKTETPPADLLALESKVRGLLAPWAYTETDVDLENLVLESLARENLRIVFAESCTSGLAVHRLTRVPGSSERVWGGYTCYQIDAKKRMLDVVIDVEKDAISRECTRALAESALAKSGCDVAAAITGYMGPGGGTAEEPAGAFYVCVMGSKRGGRSVLENRIVQLSRERELTQWGAATHLLNSVRVFLDNKNH